MIIHTESAAAPSITYHTVAVFGSAGGVTGEDADVPVVTADVETVVIFVFCVVTFVAVVCVGVVET